MSGHEEFLELCAAATAGELTLDEKAKLEAHLKVCPECRDALRDFEAASLGAIAAMSSDTQAEQGDEDTSWSVEKAEKALFKRLDQTKNTSRAGRESDKDRNRPFTLRPSQIRPREVWMALAAAAILAVALGITAYKTGIRRGTEVAKNEGVPSFPSAESLEAQLSDIGHERNQLLAKLSEQDKVVAELKQQLSEQQKTVSALRSTSSSRPLETGRPTEESTNETHEGAISAAQAKLRELQKTVETLTSQREELSSRAASLEAKVGELTELARNREEALDERSAEVTKQKELLDHDRDIRELMGARDLYIAEVHDVSGKGTDKTYGRIFYTRGKRLVFYAYDLDTQPGIRNASTFQAWGRRGPDKEQALSLGIFYEDNVSKKRWVLKANDPRTLEDIDAVFVTVEPNGGSQHPRGKQLLFAYLRVSPNHP